MAILVLLGFLERDYGPTVHADAGLAGQSGLFQGGQELDELCEGIRVSTEGQIGVRLGFLHRYGKFL